jgi:hypothetical protein
MRVEKIDINLIEHERKALENHIIFYFDKLVYGKGPIDVEKENINEAFFFNKETCLHLYRESGLNALLINKDESDVKDGIIEERQLCPERSKFEYIVVNKYIKYDEEDGQAFISMVLPSELI